MERWMAGSLADRLADRKAGKKAEWMAGNWAERMVDWSVELTAGYWDELRVPLQVAQ